MLIKDSRSVSPGGCFSLIKIILFDICSERELFSPTVSYDQNKSHDCLPIPGVFSLFTFINPCKSTNQSSQSVAKELFLFLHCTSIARPGFVPTLSANSRSVEKTFT